MIQLQMLNYFLSTKDSSPIILNNLTAKYFSDYNNEFNYIYNHLQQYGNIPDKETFLSAFQDFNLVEVKESSNYLIEELFKDYKQKQLAKTFNSVRSYIVDGDLEKAMTCFKNGYDNISTAGISLQPVDILKDTSRLTAYLDKTTNFEKFYLSTGFKEVDELIGGIDREEELGVVVARTSRGKTWMLLKMASAAVIKGLNVGLYSGEMSANKVGYRLDTLLGHINNGSLIHGNVDVENDYKDYMKELPNKYKGSLKVLTPQQINGPAGVNALRAFIEKEKLDILFIDQLSLLEDDRHAKNPIEKASNISKDLKNLQVLKKIPIISVSQQNRNKIEGEEDTIDTTQLAMSDRIAQDATLILGLTRDKKDDQLLTIHFVKVRDGSIGKRVTYRADLNKGEFYYIPTDTNNSSINSPSSSPEDFGGGNIF